MNLPKIRKSFLWSFIGFLSLTALIAIVVVLSGNFGETQLKVLATTFTISASSICAMACAAFVEKQGRNIFGFLGIIAAAFSCALTIIGIWCELNSNIYWKTTVVLIVVAVGIAYSLLLFIPRLAPAHKWTQTAAIVCIAILSLEIICAVSLEVDNEAYFRLMAVTSIVTVLMTLVVPICLKLRGKEHEDHLDRLILHKVSDDIYTDPSGHHFRVTQVES